MDTLHLVNTSSSVSMAITYKNLTSGRKGVSQSVIKMESLSVRDTEYNSEMFQKPLITRLL